MALEGSSHAHDRSEEGVTIWNISSHSEILNVKLILFSDLILMCKMTPPRQLLESSTFASTFKFKQKNSQKVDDDSSNMQRDKTLNDWLKLSMGWTFNWLMQTLQRLMHKSYEGTSICCPSLRPSNLIRWLCLYIKKRIYFINQLVSKAWFKRQPVV